MTSSPRSVLVTGANRGIGLGIIDCLLKNKNIDIVIAGVRNIANAKSLEARKSSDNRLHIAQLDISDDNSIDRAVNEVAGIVGEKGLNVLINNAGTILYYDSETIDRQKALEAINVNAIGALITSQKFKPLLLKAAMAKAGSELSSSRAAIINIGSECSSVALNTGSWLPFGLLAHRMAKASMLSFTKTLSVDYKKAGIPILVTCIHPGWVASEMGGPEAPVSVADAASGIVDAMMRMDETHAGGLFEKDLTAMPF